MDDLGPLLFEAARQSAGREVLPTGEDTAGLRSQIEAAVRTRSVFAARATNAIFVSRVKEVVTAVADGRMNEATARWTLIETLRAVDYTPEGGFPDAPEGAVPPAVRGSIQDLSSKSRLDLIVRTQVDLMRGAATKARGMQPDGLRLFPAWELVRVETREVPRDWGGEHVGTPLKRAGQVDMRSRWEIAGGTLADGRMIALKGDPIWGEVGSSENFDDALDVDYPPFAFNSGMGWREVPLDEVRRLGITGPDGESVEEWLAEERAVLGGEQPPVTVPDPVVSLRGVDPEIRDRFVADTGAVMVGDAATTEAGAQSVADRVAAIQERRRQRRQRLLDAE